MKSLERPTFRKAFAVDPLGALERTRFDAERLSREQLDVLAGLSEEELEIVAGVLAQLRAASANRTISI
jgi:hypothetical protein